VGNATCFFIRIKKKNILREGVNTVMLQSDFLEAGDVLGDCGYEYEGLHNANHNVGKAMIALEVATYL
jgi:hypothetical protein